MAWVVWLGGAALLWWQQPSELRVVGAWGVVWITAAVTWGWIAFVGVGSLVGRMLRRILWRGRSLPRSPVPPVRGR